MTCNEAEILIHAMLDGELDAGHAREVEDHIAGCSRCSAQLRATAEMKKAVSEVNLRYITPLNLRQRLDAALPTVPPISRRSILRGFAVGSVVSAIAATGVVVLVLRNDDEQRLLAEVVSAHLRSLQADHLTDVLTSDQHTVKPWFNGKLDVAPPVVDLTQQGFTLVGGRLDYVDTRSVGAIVYRRRAHVVNLFVAPTANTERRAAKTVTVHGFNIRHWGDGGLNYWAVSDIAAEELAEFTDKFEIAIRTRASDG
jgi:anti-sigma factor RsiW